MHGRYMYVGTFVIGVGKVCNLKSYVHLGAIIHHLPREAKINKYIKVALQTPLLIALLEQ